MQLTFKGLNKKGTQALYSGLRKLTRISIESFDGDPAQTLTIDGNVRGPVVKTPAVRLTKEQRAALPKPTLAEKIARREATLAKLKAKADAQAKATQPASL